MMERGHHRSQAGRTSSLHRTVTSVYVELAIRFQRDKTLRESRDIRKKEERTHERMEKERREAKRKNNCRQASHRHDSNMREVKEAISTYRGKHMFIFREHCANKLSVVKTSITKKKKQKHKLLITQRICGHCRQKGHRNTRNMWTWWADQEVKEINQMTPSAAAGAQVAAAAGEEERKVTGAIRHQHFDPKSQKRRTGSLPHGAVTVEIRVDRSMWIGGGGKESHG